VIPYNLIIAKQRNGPTDKLDILFHAPTRGSTIPCGTKHALGVKT